MYKRQKRLFFFLSMLSWMGTLGFLIVYGICIANGKEQVEEGIVKPLLELFVPLLLSYILCIFLMIFIREKVRNTAWIANAILSAVYFGKIAVYAVLALYALDEFIFIPLWKHYKLKYQINKEIDKRVRPDRTI